MIFSSTCRGSGKHILNTGQINILNKIVFILSVLYVLTHYKSVFGPPDCTPTVEHYFHTALHPNVHTAALPWSCMVLLLHSICTLVSCQGWISSSDLPQVACHTLPRLFYGSRLWCQRSNFVQGLQNCQR